MSAIRRNILSDSAARDAYVRGCVLLKAEDSGSVTSDFGIGGPPLPVGTFDLFVAWHYLAMSQMTPPPPAANPDGRNAAHMGPVFLPWHRVMLMMLERNLQRVLADANFGLPYWDWAADGDRPVAQQPDSLVWDANCMGGDGAGPSSFVADGAFRHDPGDPSAWRVRLAENVSGALVKANRGLRRAFGGEPGVADLPNGGAVAGALARPDYDAAPWTRRAGATFRNRLEGWNAAAPRTPPELHNRVHVWIGGDMLVGTSPNDPVFYLNHCNVDRLWEAWMTAPGHGRVYLPGNAAGADLLGHRIDDPIAAPFPGTPLRPRDVLDIATEYVYDTLA